MKKLLIVALSAVALSACGGGKPKGNPDPKTEADKVDYSKLELTPQSEGALVLADEDALLRHINNGLRLQVSGGANGPLRSVAESPASPGGGIQTDGGVVDESSGSGFSETNVHVQGVDEADYAKYDGSHWYIATQPTGSLNINDRTPGLKIYATDPAVPEARAIGKYSYDEKWGAVGEIYTVTKDGGTSHIASIRNQWGNVRPFLPGRDIALTRFGGGIAVDFADVSTSLPGDPVAAVTGELVDPSVDGRVSAQLVARGYWPGPQNSTIRIELVDVENPSNPQGNGIIEIDGSLIQSRKVGNMLYLVSRFDPWIKGLVLEQQSLNARDINEQIINDTPLDKLFPNYRIGDVESPLNKGCLVQSDLKKVHGLSSLVNITAIDLGSQKVVDSTCLNANVEALSMSPKSLYLTGSVYKNSVSSTVIHKFDLTEAGLSYAASGSVEGSVGWRSDPVFRMHEHEDQFRIVTSNWEQEGPVHRLTILKPLGKKLSVVSTLPNKANPQAIGKPGEDIYSVRFEGNKAYIVTFRRTDPLYAIDLSDPKNPMVTGELEIPGFATYMHPVGDGYLFTFGQDADERGTTKGLKAELISVKGDKPEVVSSFILGDRGSYSVALNDLRAFSFQPAGDDDLRVAVPVSIRAPAQVFEDEEASIAALNYTGVQLFTITDINGTAQMEDSGVAITNNSSNTYYGRGRTVLHDDAVFITYGNDVWVAPWMNIKDVQGPVKDEPVFCTRDYRAGLNVTVELEDEYGVGGNACSAVVQVSDGKYNEVLGMGNSTDPTRCEFSGAGERAGYYSIVASLPEYVATKHNVTVYEDDCHVITEAVTLTLKSKDPNYCDKQSQPAIALQLSSSDGSDSVCKADVFVHQNNKRYSLELAGIAGSGGTPTAGNDGSNVSLLRAAPPVSQTICSYEGAYNLSGEMTLAIEHPNYQAYKTMIDVEPQSDCTVAPHKVSVILDPI